MFTPPWKIRRSPRAGNFCGRTPASEVLVSLEILMGDQSGLQLDADCYTQAQHR
jgi:hypothetical protein